MRVRSFLLALALAAALVGLMLLLARLGVLLAGELTREGNRLLRLAQRLSDALERLDAAIGICVRG